MYNIVQLNFQVEDTGVSQAVCQDTICLSRDMGVFEMAFLSREIHRQRHKRILSRVVILRAKTRFSI